MGETNDNRPEESILLRSNDAGVATLTLNQPRSYNVLSDRMVSSLQSELDAIATDESTRVVVIAANGRAFCAGQDLKEMRSNEAHAHQQAIFNQSSHLMLTINRLPQPVIASVNGVAAAAGCQLVAGCDLAIAVEEARFAVSGINLGLFCSTPAVPLSRNIPRKQALNMLLTGDFISASEALQFGLVNTVVPASELASATRELALKIVARSAPAIRLGKEMFYSQLSMDLADAYAYASECMACNMGSDDAKEGIDAFMEKRKPEWKHR